MSALQIHISPAPSWERSHARDSRATRWCFNCRRHLVHSWVLLDDPPERQPSYYEPVPVLRCSRCKADHSVHPGSYHDGPAIPEQSVWDELMANIEPLPARL